MKIDKIFLLMSERGISAKELSKETGISTGNISDWKSGKCMPKTDALIKIANYFNVSVDYLLGRDVNMEKRTKSSVNYNVAEMSEAQFVMLKSTLKRLLRQKFSNDNEDFYSNDKFVEIVGKNKTTDAIRWFSLSIDHTFDNKISELIEALGMTGDSLFSDIRFAIISEEEIKGLDLSKCGKYSDVSSFPVLVDGNFIFSGLFGISLATLKSFSPSLYAQILDNDDAIHTTDDYVQDDQTIVKQIVSSIQTAKNNI